MATGNLIAEFGAANNEPPTTDPAAFDVRGDDHNVWDFDAGTDESTVYSAVMPNHYSGGGLTVKIDYMMSSAIADDVVLLAAFERLGVEFQDLDSPSFAAAKSVTITVPATNGHLGRATIAFDDGAEIDGILIGEGYRLKITRDADAGGDDAAGDLELKFVVVTET